MKTMKTVMLAGVAVLSLGARVANSQNLAPSDAMARYFEGQNKVAPAPLHSGASASRRTTEQFGSPDVRAPARTYQFDSAD
jgi:hypothetical protein